MNGSMPGFSVHHCSQFAQIHACPLGWWCYLTTSFSVVLFSFCLQYFQASGSFPMGWLFSSGDWSIGALPSVLAMNIQGWFPSLLFNTLSRFVIAFLIRSRYLISSWLQSPSAVILEPKKIKSVFFHFLPFCLPWSDGTRCHNLRGFWMLSFKPAFSLSSSTVIKRFFNSSSFSAISVV